MKIKEDWWQWFEIEAKSLWYDDPTDYDDLAEIKPQSIFVVEYHANTLPKLAEFLKDLLEQYGGWVDCKGSFKKAFTLENIADIVLGCP